MTQNTIDIIVVTYNRLEYFKTFVEELYKSTKHPFRIIVVDNGSTDGTRTWILEKEKEGVIGDHVFTDENMLMAAPFTEGFKKVKSDLFVTVADDMTAPLKNPDWLTVFVAKMADESVGCINFRAARQDYNEFKRKSRV